MKVIRFTNGRKVAVVPSNTPPNTVQPTPTPNPPRIIKKVTQIPPQAPAAPSKGCGCGK